MGGRGRPAMGPSSVICCTFWGWLASRAVLTAITGRWPRYPRLSVATSRSTIEIIVLASNGDSHLRSMVAKENGTCISFFIPSAALRARRENRERVGESPCVADARIIILRAVQLGSTQRDLTHSPPSDDTHTSPSVVSGGASRSSGSTFPSTFRVISSSEVTVTPIRAPLIAHSQPIPHDPPPQIYQFLSTHLPRPN